MIIFEYDYETGKGQAICNLPLDMIGIGIAKTTAYFSKKRKTLTVHEKFRIIGFDHDLYAENFGVKAICFCYGTVDGKRQWAVVGTKTYADVAKRTNMKVFGHEHFKFK